MTRKIHSNAKSWKLGHESHAEGVLHRPGEVVHARHGDGEADHYAGDGTGELERVEPVGRNSQGSTRIEANVPGIQAQLLA